MEVTVAMVGEDRRTVQVEGDTYGDVLRAVDLSPQEATVLVDGRPVPADREIDETDVRVLRLISGGDGSVGTDSVDIRPARPGEAAKVVGLLDAAMLAFDREDVRRRVGGPSVRVAIEAGRLRGAVVLDENHIEAVAVRRAHRGRGIGSALVETVAADRPQLTAMCEPADRDFYESLGFELAPLPDGRLAARR